ncbi:MAG: C25 family cysteine peptidase, partial [candidate division WOR-3 bacterium]|nr:C25 family cysteine peptidase [candidate division WOR-3 bacterium]
MHFMHINKKNIALLSFLSCAMLGANWIPFTQGASMRGAETYTVSATDLSVTMDIDIFGIAAEDIDTKGMVDTQNEIFALLSIPDGYHTGELGKPKMPAIKKTVGVPYGAEIAIEITNAEYRDIELESVGIDKRIMPVLAPVEKMPGKKPVFEIDSKLYAQNELYPEGIARIESEDLMRGHRLAVIEITPLQYNPVTKILRCYTRFELKVTFTGGDMTQTRKEILTDYSPLFEDFIKRRVANYTMYENITRDVLPLPIHYLIITHNSFQTQVNDLALWLKQKGFKVKVANQDTITSWTIAGIENYIDAQNPLPTYLLLVGDVNGGYIPAPTGSQSQKVTDLYYAETDGSGYLPDILYGRLSVETATHITTVVDKILKYEKAQLPDMASWFKKDAFLAGNDNYSITEGTHNYCTSMFMDPYGYTTYKVYEQTYGATTADVFTNVNEGRILTTMSGHGSDDGWYDGPPFQVTHVNQLTNGDKLTIATGHCCLANNFGWGSGPCGGESWIRKANGGAVAYYGSCPSTYWSEDDWLQKEWYRAIYADSMFEHARFTLDGMYDGIYLSSTSLKQYYYEGYHVLGDPSLDLWTEVPVSMVVTYDGAVVPATADFTVSVTGNGSPLKDALVCAWIPGQSPEMHVSEYTNAAGIATLSISPTTPGDTMYVTVTKHDFIPHEGYAMVIAPSGPYVTAGSTIINDGNNGQANPGETVQLGVWAKNLGVATANSVYGLISESDPYISLGTDSSWYGNIAPSDSSLSTPNYSFTVANNCPDGHAINFTLDFTDIVDTTWTCNVNVTVYAPLLVYQEYLVTGGNGNGILEPGETVDLAITLENEGGAA